MSSVIFVLFFKYGNEIVFVIFYWKYKRKWQRQGFLCMEYLANWSSSESEIMSHKNAFIMMIQKLYWLAGLTHMFSINLYVLCISPCNSSGLDIHNRVFRRMYFLVDKRHIGIAHLRHHNWELKKREHKITYNLLAEKESCPKHNPSHILLSSPCLQFRLKN